QALDQPTIEDFMLIADGTDLNPAMLVRWRAYLSRTRKERDPAFVPWHALAVLPDGEFAARSAALIARFAAMVPATGAAPGQAPGAADRRAEVADHRPRRAGAGPEPGGGAGAGRAAGLHPGESPQPGRARPAPVPRRPGRPRPGAVPRRQRPARAGPSDRQPG